MSAILYAALDLRHQCTAPFPSLAHILVHYHSEIGDIGVFIFLMSLFRDQWQ